MYLLLFLIWGNAFCSDLTLTNPIHIQASGSVSLNNTYRRIYPINDFSGTGTLIVFDHRQGMNFTGDFSNFYGTLDVALGKATFGNHLNLQSLNITGKSLSVHRLDLRPNASIRLFIEASKMKIVSQTVIDLANLIHFEILNPHLEGLLGTFPIMRARNAIHPPLLRWDKIFTIQNRIIKFFVKNNILFLRILLSKANFNTSFFFFLFFNSNFHQTKQKEIQKISLFIPLISHFYDVASPAFPELVDFLKIINRSSKYKSHANKKNINISIKKLKIKKEKEKEKEKDIFLDNKNYCNGDCLFKKNNVQTLFINGLGFKKMIMHLHKESLKKKTKNIRYLIIDFIKWMLFIL